jgi:hypothetical protein
MAPSVRLLVMRLSVLTFFCSTHVFRPECHCGTGQQQRYGLQGETPASVIHIALHYLDILFCVFYLAHIMSLFCCDVWQVHEFTAFKDASDRAACVKVHKQRRSCFI